MEKTISHILQSSPALCNLIDKAERLTRISHNVHEQLQLLLEKQKLTDLPVSLNDMLDSLHLANYTNGVLTLHCHNAAIATRLRYLLPELLQCLRIKNVMPELANIHLRVVPDTTSANHSQTPQVNFTNKPIKRKNKISEEQFKKLKQFSEDLKRSLALEEKARKKKLF